MKGGAEGKNKQKRGELTLKKGWAFGDGLASCLLCCSPWDHKESDTPYRLNHCFCNFPRRLTPCVCHLGSEGWGMMHPPHLEPGCACESGFLRVVVDCDVVVGCEPSQT